jgi:ankyrin repeat protein
MRFQNNEGISPAHIAAQLGDTKILRIIGQYSRVLLNTVTRKGWLPLHFAIFHGRLEAVQYLLQLDSSSSRGQVKNQPIIAAESVLDCYPNLDLCFLSPLDLAQYVKAQPVVEQLLKVHALPSLHCAVIHRDMHALSYHLFSRNRADLNLQASYRKATALHYAAAFNFEEVCQALMQSGARGDLRDCDGRSPLDIAVLSESDESVLVIAEHSSPSDVARAMFLAAEVERLRHNPS